MADKNARQAAIKKATTQVRSGGAFVRRANTVSGVYRSKSGSQTASKKSR
jgi:hypothetical protein